MRYILKNKPEIKEKNMVYIVITVLLSLLSLVLLMLPVIVNIMNGFAEAQGKSDIIYYIFRGLFGVSIAVGVSIFAVKKDASAVAIPCLVGFITSLFPLYDGVSSLTNAYTVAKQLSMSVGFGPYLVTIGESLLCTLLCLFTLLFVCGILKQSFVILLISVVTCLSVAFTAINNYVTYDITIFEVLSFGYTAIASIIPLVLVFAVKPSQRSETRYKARRMK